MLLCLEAMLGCHRAGAEALASCLERMPLKCLDLARNHIRSEGASALGLALQRSTSMQALYAQHNGVREAGAIALAVGLKSCESMSVVDLSGNSFPFVRVRIASILKGCERPVQFVHE
jgi:Ran GTPase-activating protein (RanGAP) involved in mRNA processing and transport